MPSQDQGLVVWAPPWPTARALLAEVTPERLLGAGLGLGTVFQVVLFHCSIRGLGAADAPTAQALRAATLAGEPPDPACAHLLRPGERLACGELVCPGMGVRRLAVVGVAVRSRGGAWRWLTP